MAAVRSKRRASVYTGVSWLAEQHSASKAGLGSVELIRVFVHYYNGDSVVSCAVRVGNVSWILFQEGRSSNLRLRRGVRQAARARNNPHVKCTGVYCAWIVNNAVTSELYWVQPSGSWIPSLTLTLIVQLRSKLLVTAQDGSADCYWITRPLPLHTSNHTLLAR